MVSTPSAPSLVRLDRPSVRDHALDQLKRYIASGAVATGQRLPSERDLAATLGIGRNSVREALKVLEAVGIVESRIGEGTFIVDQTGASIGRTIGLNLATWGGTLVEILDARRLLEGAAAARAAAHRTPADLAELEVELDAMERSAATAPNDYFAADMRFHRLVARATGNAIVAGVIGQLVDTLESVMHEAQADQIAILAEGRSTHRDIFAAIAAGDGPAAAAAMEEHLVFSTEVWAAVNTLGAASGDGRDGR